MENNNIEQNGTFSDDVGFNSRSRHFFSTREKSREVRGRTFTQVSKVIPEQTYTIRELFERAVVGSMPSVERQVYYEDDSLSVDDLFNRSGVDLSTLDLVELDAMQNRVSETIENYKRSRSVKPLAQQEQQSNEI